MPLRRLNASWMRFWKSATRLLTARQIQTDPLPQFSDLLQQPVADQIEYLVFRFGQSVTDARDNLDGLRLACAIVKRLRTLGRQNSVRTAMNQQQRFRRQFAHHMRTRELTRQRNHSADYGAQRSRIYRDCAAERMPNQRHAIVAGTAQEGQRRNSIDEAFAEFVGSAIVEPRDRQPTLRHFQPKARIQHRRAVEPAHRTTDA